MSIIIKTCLALFILFIPLSVFALDTNCTWTYNGWQCRTQEDTNEILRRGLQSQTQQEQTMRNLQQQESNWINSFLKNLTRPLSLPNSTNTVSKTPDETCRQNYGQYSYYTNQKNEKGNYICDCMNNYEWNTSRTTCVAKKTISNEYCKINYGQYSYLSNNYCECMSGYIWNGSRTSCILDNKGIVQNNNVVQKTPDQICQQYYGQYSYYINKKNENGGYICDCKSGYNWNTNRSACVKQTLIIENKINPVIIPDKKIADRYSGYILIQKDINIAWYLNPKDKKRYLLNSSTDLLRLIQTTAIFADSQSMASYIKNPAKASGRFILSTKNSKGYFVNPKDKKLYELDYYGAGYLKLKNLGLSISNADINKISIGEIK